MVFSLILVPFAVDFMNDIQDIIHNKDLVSRTEDLVRRLDSKNREIERLCTLLESVSMVPGVNPEKILGVYDGNAEEPVVFIIRDTFLYIFHNCLRHQGSQRYKNRSIS
jgi:hypothetical protein